MIIHVNDIKKYQCPKCHTKKLWYIFTEPRNELKYAVSNEIFCMNSWEASIDKEYSTEYCDYRGTLFELDKK